MSRMIGTIPPLRNMLSWYCD